MAIQSGLEQMRLSSTLNEDSAVDDGNIELSEEGGGRESGTISLTSPNQDSAADESQLSEEESRPESGSASSISKQDLPNNTKNIEISEEHNEPETGPSYGLTQSTSQHINHPDSTDTRSRQTSHISEAGIYMQLVKSSETFMINLGRETPKTQERVASLILDCCNMACYAFYERNELWSEKLSVTSHPFERRFFEKIFKDKLQLPKDFTFFETSEWLHRIEKLLSRRDPHLIQGVDNWLRAVDCGLSDGTRIPRMMWPLGGIDVSVCEESLVSARNLCQHLRYWEGAQWLKALHLTLLKPDLGPLWFVDFFARWGNYRASVLVRPPKGPEVIPRPPPTNAETARKRARTDGEVQSSSS